MKASIFKNTESIDDIFNFFKEKKLLEQPDFTDIIEDLESFEHKFFEISSAGGTVFIAKFHDNDDLDAFEKILKRNQFVNYIISIKSDFSEFRFLKRDAGTGKLIRLRKNLEDMNDDRFLKKLDSLEFDKLETFEKIFDRREIIEEFYDLYCDTEKFFTKKIKGIPDEEEKELFASLIIQRIMFLWFLQEKTFLDQNENYFISKFIETRGKGENYYQNFLNVLFFKGLCEKEIHRENSVKVLIRDVPYLNGGLFVESQIEEKYGNLIEISNDAFFRDIQYSNINNEKNIPLLNLLESKEWTVDERSEHIEQLNPEILGYIFEKSINQKNLGAVYTPEEITTYIGENTIYPFLIDKFNEKYGSSFSYSDDIEDDFINKLNDDQLKYVFSVVKKIDILDPAVGSGHFLVDSIITLEKIYNILYEKKIIDWSPFEIREYIITENLYGVDLLPGAVEICKLRLFLTLAETFNSKEDIKPLPNIEFNIRDGNSLIGFISELDLNQEFFSLGPVRTVLHKNMPFLRDNQPFTAEKAEKILGNLGAINTKQLFKIRNELVKAYRNLHNHDIQTELRSVIYKLTKTFNEELNNNFYQNIESALLKDKDLSNEYRDFVKSNKSKKTPSKGTFIHKKFLNLRPFHWVMEYSEVIDNGGFDIVIGNPPYIRADKDDPFVIDERRFLKKIKFYETLHEKWDMYIPFIELGLRLLKQDGYFSYIVEDSYNASKYTIKSHRFLLDNSEIKELNFCSEAHIFPGVGVKNTIFSLKNSNNPLNIPKRFKHVGKFGEKKVLSSSSQKDFNIDLFNPIKKPPEQQLKFEMGKTFPLDKICYVSVGMVLNADEKKYKGEFEKKDLISNKMDKIHPSPYVEGKNINRAQIKDIKFLEWNTERVPAKIRRKTFPELYPSPKILSGSITGCTYDNIGLFCNHSIVVIKPWLNLKNVYNRSISNKAKKDIRPELENISKKFHLKYIFLILNSKFIEYLIKQDQRNKISIYPDDISPLPIKVCSKDIQEKLVILADYILFLSATEERKKSFEYIIEFLDNEIVNNLIYELYFKENFYKNGLYSEAKGYLLKIISDILIPIEFDKWAKIHWEKQINGVDNEEIIKMADDFLIIIEKFYKALIDNSQIKTQIEIIRSHKWVREIED